MSSQSCVLAKQQAQSFCLGGTSPPRVTSTLSDRGESRVQTKQPCWPKAVLGKVQPQAECSAELPPNSWQQQEGLFTGLTWCGTMGRDKILLVPEGCQV